MRKSEYLIKFAFPVSKILSCPQNHAISCKMKLDDNMSKCGKAVFRWENDFLLLKIIFSSPKNYFKLSDVNKTYLDILMGRSLSKNYRIINHKLISFINTMIHCAVLNGVISKMKDHIKLQSLHI